MKIIEIFLSAATFFVLSSAAYAKCSGPDFKFKLGQQTNTQRVTDGGPCRFTLNFTGSPIYGTQIVARPQHGSVSVSGRTTVTYFPSAHYKGGDDFSFQWIGKEGGVTPMSTTVNVSITVR